MITPREAAERIGPIPLPQELFEMIHNISLYLLMDDKSDIGLFTYHGRDDHYYHGRKSPDHPSALHHWIYGFLGIFTAQIGALAAKGMEMYNDYKRMEAGDIDKNIRDILEDDNTVALDDYKQEVKAIPLVIEPVDSVVNMKQKHSYRSPPMPREITGLPGF